MDIQLATSQELIDELLKRQTFVGFVVFSPEEHKSPTQIHDGFTIATNFPQEQVWNLMQTILEQCHDDHS